MWERKRGGKRVIGCAILKEKAQCHVEKLLGFLERVFKGPSLRLRRLNAI